MVFNRPRFIFGVVTFWGLFLITGLFSPAVKEQSSKNNFSLYWQQRASLFQVLPDTPGEIIFLGDSITDGCNWSEFFQDWRVKNRGISGDTTDGVLARLDEVLSSRPAKVFLMIGVNDLALGRTPDYVINNIKLMIKRIKASSPATEIYIQSILPVNPAFKVFTNHVNKTQEIKAINHQLQRFAKRIGIEFIDLFTPMATAEGYLNPNYTNDGLHLTGKGYLVWKSIIEEKIRRD
ncbi:GDSL-type esterase/lipase family protein [Candidatus Aminicenantes bacterium AC-334-K16]|jgi:lysophospholipase L1-like esterase|nr:GDSL-type esterase/lipase family protein [Candidatus Aminicenantes bacterium AC-334-K16]